MYVPGGRPDPGSRKSGGRPWSWRGPALPLHCCSPAEGRFQSHCPECRWRLQNLRKKFRPTESTETKGRHQETFFHSVIIIIREDPNVKIEFPKKEVYH